MSDYNQTSGSEDSNEHEIFSESMADDFSIVDESDRILVRKFLYSLLPDSFASELSDYFSATLFFKHYEPLMDILVEFLQEVTDLICTKKAKNWTHQDGNLYHFLVLFARIEETHLTTLLSFGNQYNSIKSRVKQRIEREMLEAIRVVALKDDLEDYHSQKQQRRDEIDIASQHLSGEDLVFWFIDLLEFKRQNPQSKPTPLERVQHFCYDPISVSSISEDDISKAQKRVIRRQINDTLPRYYLCLSLAKNITTGSLLFLGTASFISGITIMFKFNFISSGAVASSLGLLLLLLAPVFRLYFERYCVRKRREKFSEL